MPAVAFNRGHLDVARIAPAVFEIIAARAEVTALGAFMRQGEIAGDRHQRPRVLVGPGQRDRAEEGLRIGVAHLVEDILDRAGFNRLA